MALATLSIDLVAKLGELQAGMDQAGRIAERTANDIRSRFDGAAAAAKGFGAALVGVVSVGATVGAFRAVIDGLDRLNDAADATGASIENLSALEDIAARTGTGMDTVAGSIVKLNKVLGDASKPGSEAANALKAIGLSAAELKAQDPAQALQAVAVALSGYADDGNKARIVQELFGKSIAQVAPLLKDLAEAGQLNATVTRQQAAEAEAFNKQLSAFAKNAEDAKRGLVSELLPGLNAIFARLNAGRQAFGGFWEAYSQGAFAADPFGDAGTKIQRYGQELERLTALRDKVANDPQQVARKKALQDIDADIEKVKKYEAYYRKVFVLTAADNGQSDPAELARRGRGAQAALPDISVPAPKNLKADAGPKVMAYQMPEATRAALAAIAATDVNKINDINAALDALFDMRASGLGGGAEVDAAIEKLRTELQQLDPAVKAAAEQQAKLNALLAATPTGQLAALRRDAELLTAEMEKTTDATRMGELAEAWALVIEKIRELRGEVKPVADEISEFARTAASNIQSTLGETLVQGLGGNFSDIGRLWENMLKQMLAQVVAANLSEAILGKGYGTTTSQLGGASGSLITALMGLFGGNTRAAGGPVTAGVPYLVGEQGPEIVVPKRSGTVLPNGTGLAVAGGQSVTVNVTGPVPQETVALIRAEVGRALSVYQRRASMAGAS